MGYTHYWHRKGDFSVGEWRRIMQRAERAIISAAKDGIVTAGGTGEENSCPQIDKEIVLLNGLGTDAYETFILRREAGEPYSWQPQPEKGQLNFVKTGGRPYDRVVVDILRAAYLASGSHAITVSSDGDVFDDLSGGTT